MGEEAARAKPKWGPAPPRIILMRIPSARTHYMSWWLRWGRRFACPCKHARIPQETATFPARRCLRLPHVAALRISPCQPAKGNLAGHAFVATDRALDCHRSGPLWLKDPRIAALVVKAIRIGESDKLFYELCAWVVMPNHVHLLIQPKADLPVITRWLKGSTARGANQLLERTGQAFWQDESYDHWARDAKEFVRICRYIEDNPVTAGLAGSAELWPWSSAGSR